MKTKTFASIFMLLFLTRISSATEFIPVAQSFPKVINGAAAWADFNKDGFFDLAMFGDTGVAGTPALVFMVFKNNGDETFTQVASFPGLVEGEIKWADIDHDGWPDLFACGAYDYDPGWGIFSPATKIYKNNGDDSFTEITGHGLADLSLSSLDVADLDKDGDIDVVISGMDMNSLDQTMVFHNNGNNTFDTVQNIEPLHHSRLKLGDYEKDGYPDIVLSGFGNSSSSPFTMLYQNMGDGTFMGVNSAMSGVAYGDICWADFNNDGFDDVAYTGSYQGASAKVYKNNYPTFFQDSTDTDVPGLLHSSLDVGDFDIDGDLDMFLMGSNVTAFSQLLLNDGNFSFSKDAAVFPGIVHPTFAKADFNNDHKMDFLISGPPSDAGAKATYLYKNNASAVNEAPSAPSNLQASDDEGEVTFSWDASADPQGNANTISYNIYIGSAAGTDDVLGAYASLSDGKHYTMNGGNNGHATSVKINLAPGTYYWAVQAIDNNNMASAFSAEQILNTIEISGLKDHNDPMQQDIYYNAALKTICYSFKESGNQKVSLEVFDCFGRNIGKINSSGLSGSIDAGSWQPGVYLVVTNHNEYRTISKVIIR
ncbi:MAG: VCBS repeat-containing protein [Bacteroidales bacterium]|nr:VCBS repeat-containing protein [Bacteroidales bacterium]